MAAEWRVHRIDHRDPVAPFEQIIGLIDVSGPATGAEYGRSDVVEALQEGQPAAAAVAGRTLVGAAVARVSGPDAHLLSLSIHPEWRNRGIGSALLTAIDQEVVHRGARRILALVRPGQVGELALVNQGFSCLEGLQLYERSASMVPEELAIVERHGGHFPAPGLWEAMKGFKTTKDLLERRVVAPLSHRDLAGEVGLVPPAAVLLFGPPGTGKTSFARAVASRLAWAFVELHPSLLGKGAEGAAALRGALDDLSTLERIVCFIDEADEIAADRAGRPENQAIVNELLKWLPAFRSRPNRLMVMATNSIAALDPARPVYVEGESRRIGQVQVPDALTLAQHAAEGLLLEAEAVEAPRREPAGQRRGHADQQRDHDQHGRRAQGRIAGDVLEVLLGDEEGADHHGERECRDERRARYRR